MRSLFSRIPAAVWSGIFAFFLTVFAGGIWTLLLISNVATSPAIPWSVVVMAFLLWLMWQYLGGKWGPRSTSQARRRYLRARPLSVEVFAWAFVAGALSIVALVGYWIVLHQLVKLPARVLQNFSGYSFAHCGARADNGIARFLPGRRSRFPWVFPGHSGTKDEWPGRHRDCSHCDCTGARPDAGLLVAYTVVVFFRGRDVWCDGLLHQVDSAERRGSQPWPFDLLRARVAI